MNVRFFVATIFVSIAWWFGAACFAAECPLPPATATNVMGQLGLARACIGDVEDAHPLSVKVLTVTENCNPPTRDSLLELRRQLAAISRELEVEGNSLSLAASADWAALTANLRQELQNSSSELQEIAHPSDRSFWEWNDGRTLQRNDSFLVDYTPIIQGSCGQAQGRDQAACAAVIATAARVIRVVNLTATLHQCAAQPRLQLVRKRLEELDAQWNSYFFKTRSQYIWELVWNERRFKARDDVFAEPPKDQIIIAHPSVAYEYVGGGARNERAYDAIVYAELLGYNRFGDSLKGGSFMSGRPALGGSIVATYTPDNTGDRVGYGIMLHAFNTFSLGATRRDTGAGKETTYLLSADFMRIVLKPSEALMKHFRGAGAPTKTSDDE
jgi:hypothetical protein